MTARLAVEEAPQGYRLYHAVAMVFVTSLIIANTVAVKVAQIGPFAIAAGIVVFPVAYIFGDILTECYGYRRTRTIVYWGFACLGMMAVLYYLAVQLPPASFWGDQDAYSRLFGFVPRIVVASLLAYLAGELVNSILLSKLKVATNGRHFWLRAMASTIVGQCVDSALFNVIAFWGVFPWRDVVLIASSGWLLKSLYELIALPLTYRVTAFVKRIEGIDVYDRGVKYNPLPGSKR